MIVFCPSFFASDDPAWHSETLIHEFAHALTAGVDITDRAYRSDRLYSPAIVSGITTAEALTNADSYAVFTREVATGEMVSVGGPVDPLSGCTAAWIQPVRRTLARAQRWNRDAQVAISSPAMQPLFTDLQSTHLGGTTAAHLAPAQRAYDAVESRLGQSVNIACDTSTTGPCAAANYHIDGVTLKLCQSWLNLATDDDRIVALLEALYEQHAGIADAAVRASYARLAADLNRRFWSAEAEATVLGGGT